MLENNKNNLKINGRIIRKKTQTKINCRSTKKDRQCQSTQVPEEKGYFHNMAPPDKKMLCGHILETKPLKKKCSYYYYLRYFNGFSSKFSLYLRITTFYI